MPNLSVQGVQASEIHSLIKEYLQYYQLNKSVQLYEQELQKRGNEGPKEKCKLVQLLNSNLGKSKTEQRLQKDIKTQSRKYQEVLQAGRQIFSVAINLLQVITNIKEDTHKYQSTNQAIDNFKVQLGKHHKTIINQGKTEAGDALNTAMIKDHKLKLQTHFHSKNVEGMVEMLLSLRVNALQIAPQLRKSLVEQFVRRDIFRISEQSSFQFLLEILSIKNKQLRHAITSLISVVVSTLRGIQYITYNGETNVLEKVVKIMKEQDGESVTMRFCLAILQKCSVKDSLINVYLQGDLLNWVLNLVRKSLAIRVHVFCLDFATAMLANLLHFKTCQLYLQKKPQLTAILIEGILKSIREPLEVSVLMHLLIGLSYLCRDRFKNILNELHVVKRMNDFVGFYNKTTKGDHSQAADMDKRTVLDLCNHMFHPKDQNYDTEERIKEYQNQQGELIFQCFQDQVS